MAESMLAILCHILRGEPVIQERLAKEREGGARPEEDSSTSSAAGPGGTGTASAAGAGPTTGGTVSGTGTTEEAGSSASRREPQVNQQQLTQVTCCRFRVSVNSTVL